MIDIHSHILPGIDDGARSMDEALRMSEMALADGINTIVATPHHMLGVYENTKEEISAELQRFREALNSAGVDIEVLPGSDVSLEDGLPGAIGAGTVMTLNDGGKFLLLELPTFFQPNQVKEQVFKLKLGGVVSVISHPERNLRLMENTDTLYDLITMGALVQITGESLSGRMGGNVRGNALKLLKLGMVHVIATDAHNTSSRPPVLSAAREAAAAVVGADEAEKMVLHTPRAIIDGIAPNLDEPRREGRRGFLGSILGGLGGGRH